MVWTGVACIVLWSEWARRGTFAVTVKVVGVLVVVMALHSLNDYATFEAPDTPALVIVGPIISIVSCLLFKSQARELTPLEQVGNVPWAGDYAISHRRHQAQRDEPQRRTHEAEDAEHHPGTFDRSPGTAHGCSTTCLRSFSETASYRPLGGGCDVTKEASVSSHSNDPERL